MHKIVFLSLSGCLCLCICLFFKSSSWSMLSPDDKLSENNCFVWSRTSYGGDKWRFHAWSRTHGHVNIVLEFCEVWTEFAICFRFSRCPSVSVRCKLTIRNSLETNALHTWELAVTLESTKDFTSCVISLCTTTKGQIFPILLLVPIFFDADSETFSNTIFFRYHQKQWKSQRTRISRDRDDMLWTIC